MTFYSLPSGSPEVQLGPDGSSCHQKPKKAPVKDLPSQEKLREFFSYDSINGNLIWKARPLSEFATEGAGITWNLRFAGSIAGSLDKAGYVHIKLKKLRLQAHRLIWVWCNGFLSKNLQIDHIDGNPSNNRIVNLRLAKQFENQRNRKIPLNNTSSIKGVYWNKKHKKWYAQIKIFNKHIYLGCFEKIEDAAAAYAKASEEVSKEFTHSSTRVHKRKPVQLEISVFQGGKP